MKRLFLLICLLSGFSVSSVMPMNYGNNRNVSQNRECPVCLAQKPADDFRWLGECEHRVDSCRDCFADYLTGSIESGAFHDVRCSRCRLPLGDADLRWYLQDQVLDRYAELVRAEQQRIAGVRAQGVTWQKRKMIWNAPSTDACPNCHEIIQKNGGCNHMTCYRNAGGCGYEFCWIDLQPWGGAHYNHQFGEHPNLEIQNNNPEPNAVADDRVEFALPVANARVNRNHGDWRARFQEDALDDQQIEQLLQAENNPFGLQLAAPQLEQQQQNADAFDAMVDFVRLGNLAPQPAPQQAAQPRQANWQQNFQDEMAIGADDALLHQMGILNQAAPNNPRPVPYAQAGQQGQLNNKPSYLLFGIIGAAAVTGISYGVYKLYRHFTHPQEKPIKGINQALDDLLKKALEFKRMAEVNQYNSATEAFKRYFMQEVQAKSYQQLSEVQLKALHKLVDAFEKALKNGKCDQHYAALVKFRLDVTQKVAEPQLVQVPEVAAKQAVQKPKRAVVPNRVNR